MEGEGREREELALPIKIVPAHMIVSANSQFVASSIVLFLSLPCTFPCPPLSYMPTCERCSGVWKRVGAEMLRVRFVDLDVSGGLLRLVGNFYSGRLHLLHCQYHLLFCSVVVAFTFYGNTKKRDHLKRKPFYSVTEEVKATAEMSLNRSL